MKRLSLLPLILFLGCYTPKKAEQQLNKAKSHYPSLVADKTSKWYPCKEVKIVTDSTAYKNWLASLDSVFNWEKDTLTITDTITNTIDCSEIKKSLISTSSQLTKAKQVIRTIKNKVIIAPAVHDTIVKVDSSQIFILTEKYNAAEKGRQKYEGKSNLWFKLGISFLIALLVSIILNVLKYKI